MQDIYQDHPASAGRHFMAQAMKVFVATGKTNVDSDEMTQSPAGRVFNFSETQIVRDGRTITVSFPDEEQPLEEKFD